jgi:hypothetical protein
MHEGYLLGLLLLPSLALQDEQGIDVSGGRRKRGGRSGGRPESSLLLEDVGQVDRDELLYRESSLGLDYEGEVQCLPSLDYLLFVQRHECLW